MILIAIKETGGPQNLTYDWFVYDWSKKLTVAQIKQSILYLTDLQ